MGVAGQMGDSKGYANKAAWDARYAENGDLFEWYAPFEYLEERLWGEKCGVKPTSKVCILGCGTSGMSAALYDKGCTDITSIDYSKTAIEIQTGKNKSRATLKFQVDDCRVMSTVGDGAFSHIIAKATIDAILASDGANANINATMKNVHKKLQPGGKLIVYSHAPPIERVGTHFKEEAWDIDTEEFVRPSVTEVQGLDPTVQDNLLFQYVLTKK